MLPALDAETPLFPDFLDRWGQANTRINFRLKNAGNSPAVSVTWKVFMSTDFKDLLSNETQRRTCEAFRNRWN